MKIDFEFLLICLLVTSKVIAQSTFSLEQEKILAPIRILDSTAKQVTSIEFKRVKFNRYRIKMTYTIENNIYRQIHKFRHKRAGRSETILIFLVDKHHLTNPKRVSRVRKLNGAYWFVETQESKLLVDKYLVLKQNGKERLWLYNN